MKHPKKFFDCLRGGILGPTLDQDEVSGCNAIVDAMYGAPVSHVAYALATAYHETAHTMQPIKEYGGSKYFFRMYDIEGNRPRKARELGNVNPGDGAKFAGRGYVQLTGRTNYFNAGKALLVDLIEDPDKALDPTIAALIMQKGMSQGWFTGKKLSDYLPDGPAKSWEFYEARRIINGLDRAADIAQYAVQFQDALILGGWE